MLVLGLDVLGNPYGLITGVGAGAKNFFYEPYQVRNHTLTTPKTIQRPFGTRISYQLLFSTAVCSTVNVGRI